MLTVDVVYHHESGSWWADSGDVPGFVAAGRTLEEVRALVKEGIPFFLEVASDEIDLSEQTSTDGPVGSVTFSGPAAWQAHGVSSEVTADLVFTA